MVTGILWGGHTQGIIFQPNQKTASRAATKSLAPTNMMEDFWELNPKIGGFYTPKMDGEKNGTPLLNKWMIWGGFPTPIFLVQHPYGMFLGV